jgi:hypothetical protein
MEFRIISTAELKTLLKLFSFKRKITALHIHHTYSPNHADFKRRPDGIHFQKAMERYHKTTKKFQAIAQHLTLLPNGKWVTGRDFNLDPASATNYNKGAFMVEMLGNFDKGYNSFGGEQTEAMFDFAEWFVSFFKVPFESIKFHREFPGANKTCPGTGIDKAWFIEQVKSKGAKYSKIATTHVANISPYMLQARNIMKNAAFFHEKHNNFVNGNFFWWKDGKAHTIGWLVSNGIIQNSNNIDAKDDSGKVIRKGTFIMYKDGVVCVKNYSNSELYSIRDSIQFCCQGFNLFPLDLAGEGYNAVEVGYQTWRLAIGYNSELDKVVIAVRPATNAERIRQTMANLGCNMAIGLDSGSSVNAKFGGNTVRQNNVTLTNIIYW